MSVRHEAGSHKPQSNPVRASIDLRRAEIATAAPKQAQATTNAPRCSPDPNAGTDRYRLAAPFSLRL